MFRRRVTHYKPLKVLYFCRSANNRHGFAFTTLLVLLANRQCFTGSQHNTSCKCILHQFYKENRKKKYCARGYNTVPEELHVLSSLLSRLNAKSYMDQVFMTDIIVRTVNKTVNQKKYHAKLYLDSCEHSEKKKQKHIFFLQRTSGQPNLRFNQTGTSNRSNKPVKYIFV